MVLSGEGLLCWTWSLAETVMAGGGGLSAVSVSVLLSGMDSRNGNLKLSLGDAGFCLRSGDALRPPGEFSSFIQAIPRPTRSFPAMTFALGGGCSIHLVSALLFGPLTIGGCRSLTGGIRAI